jgi:DNA replication protein DnaC
VTAIEAIDALLAEELTLRENRRIKIALMTARLSTIKTLAGFDFSFQHSLDKNRIMALAELEFIDRNEVVHFLGPPGTGKSHLSLALGVQAVKAGRSVYFTPLSDLVGALAKAEREGLTSTSAPPTPTSSSAPTRLCASSGLIWAGSSVTSAAGSRATMPCRRS